MKLDLKYFIVILSITFISNVKLFTKDYVSDPNMVATDNFNNIGGSIIYDSSRNSNDGAINRTLALPDHKLGVAQLVITSSGSHGLWNQSTTWNGGIVPGEHDSVIIADGDIVTLDPGARIDCGGILIGRGIDTAKLFFPDNGSATLSVDGSVVISEKSIFGAQASMVGNVVDTFYLSGDLTNYGPGFLLRAGWYSLNAASNVHTYFIGAGDSKITAGPYERFINNEFGTIVIKKTGSGNVILGGDVVMGIGHFDAGTQYCPILKLQHGLVITSAYSLTVLWANEYMIEGGSDSSYIIGTMGSGISPSGTSVPRKFPIGDSAGYRPVKVRFTVPGITSNPVAKVTLIPGNANTGSSTLVNGIDKVSAVRYYKLQYLQNTTGPVQMSFDQLSPSYGLSDGVGPGNQTLRVAISEDNRTTWSGDGPTLHPYTTTLDSLPQYISSDTAHIVTLSDGDSMYIALARSTGSHDNTLEPGPLYGLVAYYPFNGDADDESGNGNNGTVNGATLTMDRFGNSDKAYFFDGSGDNINCGNPQNNTLDIGQNATVSLWVNFNSIGTDHHVFVGKDVDALCYDKWFFYFTPTSNATGFHINTPECPAGLIGSETWTPVIGQWYHLALTKLGNEYVFFLNGIPNGQSTLLTQVPHVDADFLIGMAEGKYSVHGILDDIRMYNRSLTPEEIDSLYHEGGWDPLTQGLVAYYPFNGDADDESGMGHNGTPYGATLTSDRFGNDSCAYNFNGVDNYIKASSTGLPTDDRTISLWFNSSNLDNRPVALGYGGGVCGTSFGVGLRYNNCYSVGSHCGVSGFLTPEVAAPINKWHNIIFVSSSSGMKFYTDGELIYASALPFVTTNVDGKDLSIGVWVGPDGKAPFTNIDCGWVNGSLDDIRIYNRALTPEEIDSLYHEGGWPLSPTTLTVEPDSISFGIVEIDSSRTDSITVTNARTVPVIIDSVVSDNAYFVVTDGAGNDTLQPAQSGNYHVTFTPGFIGGTFGHIVVHHSGYGEADTVSVSGAGSVSGITFNRWWIYYGDVLVGYSKTDSVIITNLGVSPLALEPILSTIPQFTLESPSVTIPPGDSASIRITFTPTADGMAISEVTAPFGGDGSPLHIVVFGRGYHATASASVRRQWNLVSNPVSGIDSAVTSLYPNAISTAFSYAGSYISETRLENGVGYWLKFARDTVYNFVGFPVTKESVAVVAGWNLIGSLTTPIGVTTLTTNPGEMISSQIFGYVAGYVAVDTIRPGKGYWVKTDQTGRLILSSDPIISSTNRIRIIQTAEQPPPPPEDEKVITEFKMPLEYTLGHAYPSPFNPTTTIKYSLPGDSRVMLHVYNVLGQVVATLVDEVQTAGFRSVLWTATDMASGMYFYKLDAVSISNPSKSFYQIKKLILLK